QGEEFGKNKSTGGGISHADRRTRVEGRGKWKESETTMEVRQSFAMVDCRSSFPALQSLAIIGLGNRFLGSGRGRVFFGAVRYLAGGCRRTGHRGFESDRRFYHLSFT